MLMSAPLQDSAKVVVFSTLSSAAKGNQTLLTALQMDELTAQALAACIQEQCIMASFTVSMFDMLYAVHVTVCDQP